MKFLSRYKNHLLVFLIILISDETFWFGTSGIASIGTIKYLFFIVLLTVLAFSSKSSRTSNSIKLITVGLIISFLATMLFNFSISGGALLLVLLLLIAINIAHKFSIVEFSKYYCDVLFCLSALSLVVYVLVFLGLVPMSTFDRGDGSVINTALGNVFFTGTGGGLIRSSSIFREPGVYMIFINIALMLNFFVLKRISKFRLIVWSLSILSTISTAGIIIYFFNLFLALRATHNITINPIYIILIIAAGAWYLTSNSDLYAAFFMKLDAGNDNMSTLGRISSITVPFEIWLNNPILGCSPERFSDLYMAYSTSQYGFAIDPQGMSTNTIMNAAATWGLSLSSFLLFGFFRLSRFLTKNLLLAFLLFISFMLMLSNEAILYSLLIYILAVYGIKKTHS